MSRLIDRIKDTLRCTGNKQNHDHRPGSTHAHADEQEQVAPQAAEQGQAGAHEHNKEGHKHC